MDYRSSADDEIIRYDMPRNVIRLFSFMVIASCLFADSEFRFTTGRIWELLSPEGKMMYVQGFFEGGWQVTFDGPLPKNERYAAEPIVPGFLVNDYVKELDRLFSDRENILLSVGFLISNCTKRFKGTLSKQEAEEAIARARASVLLQKKSK